MRVLVADDDSITAEMLANALATFGYDVTTVSDGKQALEMIRTGLFRLVITDWEMPKLNGLELCRRIRERKWSSYVYVILLTSFDGIGNVVCGLDSGADDYLIKPFHPQELHLRLRAGERVLALESRDLTIFAMAKLAESRDADTGAHLERMREYCRIVAEELSCCRKYRDQIDGDYVELLYLTSPLHDIGKVGIPDRVLLKPDRLTREEFEVMKQHTVIGGRTLDAAAAAHPSAQYLLMARDIAMTHHERYDGSGYPLGLAGEAIPLCGRITALADVYDALTSKRVYKPEYSHDFARQIITDGLGTQFDPDVIEAFFRREADFLVVQRNFRMPELAPLDGADKRAALSGMPLLEVPAPGTSSPDVSEDAIPSTSIDSEVGAPALSASGEA